MEYKFDESLEKGKKEELVLDKYFGQFYAIKSIPLELEKQYHYDRVFERNSIKTKVEYKSDFQAHETGNVFLELTSSVEKKTLGWIHTSKAEQLIYYIVKDSYVIVIDMVILRLHMAKYYEMYKVRQCTNVLNNGSKYHSEGILVPISELLKIGKKMTIS